MHNFPWIDDSRLWLVLDRDAAGSLSLADVTQQAIAGGVDVVMCRIKDAPPEQVRQLAIPVREACRRSGIPFVMSHLVELGCELGADAVHVGIGDGQVERIRSELKKNTALGYSTHAVSEAQAVMESGADYVFLGPVFATPAKLKYGNPLGLEVVCQATALPKPVVFIGGINLATLPQLVAAGAKRIAAISALQAVPDIAGSARAIRGLLP